MASRKKGSGRLSDKDLKNTRAKKKKTRAEKKKEAKSYGDFFKKQAGQGPGDSPYTKKKAMAKKKKR